MIDIKSFKVGFFLARKDLSNSNKWSTGLIVFIMMLTFLNLVGVRGVLIGIIEGLLLDTRGYLYHDVLITAKSENDFIENSQYVLKFVSNTVGVESVVGRFQGNAVIEANYNQKIKEDDQSNITNALVWGIHPEQEDEISNLSELVIEGEYLSHEDWDYVMLGNRLLTRYFPDQAELSDVFVGDNVIVTINGHSREMTVKGIIGTKLQDLSQAIFIPDEQLRLLMERDINNHDMIVAKVGEGVYDDAVVEILKDNDIGTFATIQDFDEGMPQFIKDMIGTFTILSNVIGGVGLVVAAITTFIIIFVNAITRRKLIGIMKGIGINNRAIIFSYIVQALFYSLTGIVLATLVIYLVFEPYVAANPIDFPFSDGVLSVPWSQTLSRAGLLLLATIVAGFVPAKMIVNKNTLDSILGR